MSEIQEFKKRLRSFIISEQKEEVLIEPSMVSSTFEITDIIISNPQKKKIILKVVDDDGNIFPILNFTSDAMHSFPTGLRFWMDAKLVAETPDEMIDSEIMITIGYINTNNSTDINTWRLI